jgi:IMP dehydrogenase
MEPSRTLTEFRLLPGLTTRETSIEDVRLAASLVLRPGGGAIQLTTPTLAAAMQSVSGARMGIEMARLGGAAVIYCSQPVVEEAAMVARIKAHKAGFVDPRTIGPDDLLRDVDGLRRREGYSTFPVVDERGRLLGLITRRDYDARIHGDVTAKERMVPRAQLDVGIEIADLEAANALLIEGHRSVLPIVDREDRLLSLVFRKDIEDHLDNPEQVVDEKKRLLAVAAINTHDYHERVPALVDAGADVLVIDSSDGHTVFQKETLEWIRRRAPELPVIGGNVITGEGFDYLVASGAGAVKVGMGGGSICITQEQKGTGRGLATAVMKVVEARDRYQARTGVHVPVIADGGIVNSKDVVIALALGADVVMMGRFFARMEESPTEAVRINDRVMKPYWGEGSARAREWRGQRYGQAAFAEGVEGYVEYAGRVRDNVAKTVAILRSTFSSCGAATIADLHQGAVVEVVSALSIREGQVHDVYLPPADHVPTS